jgi:antirestriction protein ArdC
VHLSTFGGDIKAIRRKFIYLPVQAVLFSASGRISRTALSYLQAALELGGHVRKGERGTNVYFVKTARNPRRHRGQLIIVLVPVMREYTVFNVDQCECLPESVTSVSQCAFAIPTHAMNSRTSSCDRPARTYARAMARLPMCRAATFISMPAFEAFKSADHFYNVAFHEHWTAHGSSP